MLNHVVQTGTTVVEIVNYTLLMQSDWPVVWLFKTSCMLQYVYSKRTFQNKTLKNVKFQQCNLALLMTNDYSSFHSTEDSLTFNHNHRKWTKLSNKTILNGCKPRHIHYKDPVPIQSHYDTGYITFLKLNKLS